MRTKYKPWAKPYIESHPDVTIFKEEYSSIKDVYLEIGSGKGQFLVGMANKFPSLFFVGIERNVTCSGITFKKLVEEDIINAKIIDDEASVVLTNLNDKSINGIFLNFSDPWPKKRHHKRRLTASTFLNEYKRVLKDNGLIYFKTDNSDLFSFSKEEFLNNGLTIIKENDHYLLDDDFDFETEYEANFKNKGQNIYRLVLKKND